MMAVVCEDVPFSELLHHPAATAARLDRIPALRLRRRDADDLALMLIEQMEQVGTVVAFVAHLLRGLVQEGELEVLRRLLPDALPWVTFLPEADVESFMAELVTVVRASADLGNLAPIAVLLRQWQHSAEIYADPALLEVPTREPERD